MDLVPGGGCSFIPRGNDNAPRMALSPAMLWLIEATALMRGGGDDIARAHSFLSELGHFGAVWEAL